MEKKQKNLSLNSPALNQKIENKELRMYGLGLERDHPFRKVRKDKKKVNFEKKLDKSKGKK